MTRDDLKELVEMIAKKHNVKSLTVEPEVLRYPILVLEAPSMPDTFIEEVAEARPVYVGVRFYRDKTVINIPEVR